jgi:tripartite-type tricarboxylate transporter receptor subunit TctC
MNRLLAALAVTFALASQAFAWPTKTVTVVVPFPPGGSTDSVARAIAPKLQESSASLSSSTTSPAPPARSAPPS